MKIKSTLPFTLCFLLTLPAISLIITPISGVSIAFSSLIYGLGILASAFLLTWAAEAAEKDITRGLALGFIAIIAVLPEYAVDFSLAWEAGKDPTYTQYAIANMTGGNRLLIGIGWPTVIFLSWLKSRSKGITLSFSRKPDLIVLLVATLYALSIPLKGSLSLIDSIFLPSLFLFYMYILSKSDDDDETEIIGPAASIASISSLKRKLVISTIFLFSAFVIFLCAEPFAHGLIETGTKFGLDEFLLIQWIAPLASEAPEIVVACILTLRGNGSSALTILVSSKINQWSLLIGTLPIVYAASIGDFSSMQLDSRQSIEILLTAAQTFFAFTLLLNLFMSNKSALALLLLFTSQIMIPLESARLVFCMVYLIISILLLTISKEKRNALFNLRNDFKTALKHKNTFLTR